MSDKHHSCSFNCGFELVLLFAKVGVFMLGFFIGKMGVMFFFFFFLCVVCRIRDE